MNGTVHSGELLVVGVTAVEPGQRSFPGPVGMAVGGGAHVVVGELHRRADLQEVLDVFDALDARSGDYANFIPMFADTRTLGFVDLVPELDEKLEGGGEVVIIDRVRLAPAWRQLGGVGRLLTARLLR